MKYFPPRQGQYESGLTARLMYSIVDGLIKRYVTNEDIRRLKETPGFNLTKLWMKPEIRGELEEFADSYFFSDSGQQLQDFKQVVMESNGEIRNKKAEWYITQLEHQYGSRTEAKRQIALLLSELEKCRIRLYEERTKIDHVRGHVLVKENSNDAFAQIASIYGGRIALALIGLNGDLPQS